VPDLVAYPKFCPFFVGKCGFFFMIIIFFNLMFLPPQAAPIPEGGDDLRGGKD